MIPTVFWSRMVESHELIDEPFEIIERGSPPEILRNQAAARFALKLETTR
jgi:hypothetical protein